MAETLLEEIRRKCTPEQIAEAKRTDELGPIVAAVNASRVVIVETRIRTEEVLGTLGEIEGALLIDRLRSIVPPDGLTDARSRVRPLFYGLEMLDPSSTRGMDVGSRGVRRQLDGLAALGQMTAEQAAKLKALAERPDPVTDYDVSRAMHSPTGDGTWII